jgi:hypothetical protein
MPANIWHSVLVVVGYAVVTALLNLLLTQRSRIDVWCEANPNAAAAMKFLRFIGVDPWQAVAAWSLFFQGKLPAAQREGKSLPPPPFAKPPKSPSVPPLALLMFLSAGAFIVAVLIASLGGCGVVTPKTADQAALILCDLFYKQQNPALSVDDVERGFCATADAVKPFLMAAKRAQAEAGEVSLHRSEMTPDAGGGQ